MKQTIPSRVDAVERAHGIYVVEESLMPRRYLRRRPNGLSPSSGCQSSSRGTLVAPVMSIGLDDLCHALAAARGVTLSKSSYLSLPARPEPFVAPTLRVAGNTNAETPLAAEVLIVSSPAAVGKSTAARFLSATTGIPILNLSEVPVSTRALIGLLTQDVVTPTDPVGAFHRGELPLIIDALDEGRLRSGEANFEKFLETSWELLRLNREACLAPKLVLLGRDLSTADVDLSLDLYGDGITVSRFTLEFFDHDQAQAVAEAHAVTTGQLDGAAWKASAATREVIEAFFQAIESALQLVPGSLWEDEQGRAFAGYAPVLAAIGSQLAREKNPVRLRNALKASGAARAWDVIERVAEAIVDREQSEKMLPQLGHALSVKVPPEAYDLHEQLTYLGQLAAGKPIHLTSRVLLRGADVERYREMIMQLLPEHAFIQNGRFANDVLAAIVHAHSIGNDLLPPGELQVLRDASRQPFLWRSVRRMAERDQAVLLRGDYVGCVLNSLWNDTTAGTIRVEGEPADEDTDLAQVNVRESVKPWRFVALHPIEFYEQVRDCDFRLASRVIWQGHRGRQEVPTFDVRGDVTFVVASALDVSATSIRIDGTARLYAERIAQGPDVQVRVTTGSGLWIGGSFRSTYRWSDLASTLEPPVRLEAVTTLERFLEECSTRFTRPGAPLSLHLNYYPTDDPRMDWIDRDFSRHAFARFIRLLIERGLASAEKLQASGPVPKIRVHFSVSWDELLEALRRPNSASPEIVEFLGVARGVFDDG